MDKENKEYKNREEELRELRKILNAATERLNFLENELKGESEEKIKKIEPKPTPRPVPPARVAPEIKEKMKEKSRQRKISEENIGRYWLNKIGISILVLGVAFFIQYTFKYLGAGVKILLGYILGFGLLSGGNLLEKKQLYKNYGRVLIGGACATVYFTTYAMYHFPATRLINNQLTSFFLLALVSVAIIVYSFRYKSPLIAALAYFIGYLTAGLSDISMFTFVYCLLLASSLVFIVYKFKWYRLLLFGVFFTYLTHIFWIFKAIHFSTYAKSDNVGI